MSTLAGDDGIELSANSGIELTDRAGKRTIQTKVITAIGPPRLPADMFWEPEWVSFQIASGKVFNKIPLSTLDEDSIAALFEIIPEWTIPSGRLVGGGFARGAEHLDLSDFEKMDKIIKLEPTPYDVYAITTDGRIQGAKTGLIKTATGEPLEGVRTAAKQGNGALMIYDRGRNIHMLRPGSDQTEIVGEGQLERSDHIGFHEMTFKHNGKRYDLGLGVLHIQDGKLRHSSRLSLPDGVSAVLDTSGVSFDRLIEDVIELFASPQERPDKPGLRMKKKEDGGIQLCLRQK